MALDIVVGLTATQEGINRLKPAADALLSRLFRLIPDRNLSGQVRRRPLALPNVIASVMALLRLCVAEKRKPAMMLWMMTLRLPSREHARRQPHWNERLPPHPKLQGTASPHHPLPTHRNQRRRWSRWSTCRRMTWSGQTWST